MDKQEALVDHKYLVENLVFPLVNRSGFADNGIAPASLRTAGQKSGESHRFSLSLDYKETLP
jgi:hypothetical protein